MSSFGRFTPAIGGVVETLSFTSPTLTLTQSEGSSPLTATIPAGIGGSGTSTFFPKWNTSSTLNDSLMYQSAIDGIGINTGASSNRFLLTADASIPKIFSFRSANLPRWALRVDGTESGSNAGADFAFRRYNDAGTYIDSPLSMDRSDGKVTILKDATINGVNVGRGFSSVGSNTAIGKDSLALNTTGFKNTAIGQTTLFSNTDGTNNTAIGFQSLYSNISGIFNCGLGENTLFYNTIGSNNTAIGYYSLFNNTASNNTAVGFEAGYSNTTGSENTALGQGSLLSNTSGSNNTALGQGSLLLNTVGSNNTAIGRLALSNNIASNNTAVGFNASFSNTSGTNNVSFGIASLYANTTGSANIAIGVACLSGNTIGNSNSVLGTNAQSGNFDASVILGREATADNSNQFVVGSPSYNAGSVQDEVVVSNKTWIVKVNGTDYKILIADL
jgi:hypothetical protein